MNKFGVISLFSRSQNLCRRHTIAGLASLANYKALNEPVRLYKVGSDDRKALDAKIEEFSKKEHVIPICIGDEEIHSPDHTIRQVYPFNHHKTLAKSSIVRDAKLINRAIDVSLKARYDWSRRPLEERLSVFLRAADLIAGKYRYDVMAATILGQAKTIYQAEIDSTCESCDFLRFNVEAAMKMSDYKPIDGADCNNAIQWRPTEGFWASITPFNFTAIAYNLASAPAMMGNAVLWKPSDTALLSNYIGYRIFREAGLPPGIINFLPSEVPLFGDVITSSPDLGGINFTGSANTFKKLYEQVGRNISIYKSFPRLSGECGGKNFHFVHNSADLDETALSTVRSAFEFSGQKCSACSRLFVPRSVWPQLRARILELMKQLEIGAPTQRNTFSSAVIDRVAFERIRGFVQEATQQQSDKVTLHAGGKCDDSTGYFVHPTLFESRDASVRLLRDEIFGPVLTAFVYEDGAEAETLRLVDESTQFGLTGAVFARDAGFVEAAARHLRDSVGNFYVNTQSTGAVVGQQPFGGARQSGTNDKPGGPHYILKFVSPQSMKTQQRPVPSWRQAHMEDP